MSIETDLFSMLTEQGAALIGYGDLSALPEDCRKRNGKIYNYGVAIAVKMTPGVLKGIENSATADYYHEKLNLNKLLNHLSESAAQFLTAKGYSALAQTQQNLIFDRAAYSTALPHKTVATRAGLGWIGNCALLVTEQFGSALRLSSVLTDAPLQTAHPVNQSRCGSCSVCRTVCPAKAVSGQNWTAGLAREAYYSAEKCSKYAERRAAEAGFDDTLCGLCILNCPFTQRYLRKR